MAQIVYNEYKLLVARGDIDWENDDIRIALLMTNTTADTANDGVADLADLTLDEFDGSGYARQALGSQVVSKNDTNDRAELDAADVAFGALGVGTRSIQGYLIYKHVGADSANIPICFVEFSSPATPDGSAFSIQFNAAGVLNLT